MNLLMLPAYSLLSPHTQSVTTETSAVDQTESTSVLACLVEHICLCSSTLPLKLCPLDPHHTISQDSSLASHKLLVLPHH